MLVIRSDFYVVHFDPTNAVVFCGASVFDMYAITLYHVRFKLVDHLFSFELSVTLGSFYKLGA